MRILVVPDDFKGTLGAPEAARAIADGWRSRRPGDDVVCKPLSDGGPGFVQSLAAAHGVPLRTTGAVHALGQRVAAAWCRHGDTAYLEAAQVVGIDRGRDVHRATTAGLGALISAACHDGVRRMVIGLGGTCTNDGGVGMLAALGATATDDEGAPLDLTSGPGVLPRLARIDLSRPLALLADIDLVIATDVDVPLLGPRGATYGFATQKGATEDDLPLLEASLSALAVACGRRSDGKDAAVMLGAGAAGGLGFALCRLGARRASGIDVVWDESDIDLDGVDLVITGEGCLDWQSMRGKVVAGVARRAQHRGVPVIAIAGSVTISARERSAMGLDAAYSVSEMVGAERSCNEPAAALHEAAARLVRTWGTSPLE